MLAITHAAIAAAGTSLILGTGEPLPLGLAILGSQLADLDTTTAWFKNLGIRVTLLEDSKSFKSLWGKALTFCDSTQSVTLV